MGLKIDTLTDEHWKTYYTFGKGASAFNALKS
jgi:hypothetical protein